SVLSIVISPSFSTIRRPPRPPLFPYTTLFRSRSHDCNGPASSVQHLDGRARSTARAALRAATFHVKRSGPVPVVFLINTQPRSQDRKSTRLNSSHVKISYAVFCLKKKTKKQTT